jgi:small subunit ribosomal protein S20
MPTSKSAAKRLRQSRKRHQRNVAEKNKLRTLRRQFDESLRTGNRDEMETRFRAYCSELDKAVKRGILKKNTASRHKSRGALRMQKALAAMPA